MWGSGIDVFGQTKVWVESLCVDQGFMHWGRSGDGLKVNVWITQLCLTQAYVWVEGKCLDQGCNSMPLVSSDNGLKIYVWKGDLWFWLGLSMG